MKVDLIGTLSITLIFVLVLSALAGRGCGVRTALLFDFRNGRCNGEGSMYYTCNTEASPLDLKDGTGTV